MEFTIKDIKPITPHKGSLAVCSIGSLGLITVNEPVRITYPDGNSAVSWIGIHLTAKVAEVGSPWSSRSPLVLT